MTNANAMLVYQVLDTCMQYVPTRDLGSGGISSEDFPS